MRIESQQEMHLWYAQTGAIIAPMQKPKYADILRRLAAAKGKKAIDVSREAFVPQSTVSRMMAGKIQHPAYDKLSSLAEYFGVSVDQLLGKEPLIEADITRQYGRDDSIFDPPGAQSRTAGKSSLATGSSTEDALESVDVDEGEGAAMPFEVEVPYFREVELAAGDSRTEVIENHGVSMRLPVHVLQEAGVGADDAACARLRGDSMYPIIHDGAIIGVDRACTTIEDGEIYAFDHDGMLRVKFLFRMPMNRIRVVSQNSELYPDEFISPDEMQFVRIIGRVFWWQTIRPRPRH